jgi:ABC-type transport system involved in multi-copper enzyme maturation permease subunit
MTKRIYLLISAGCFEGAVMMGAFLCREPWKCWLYAHYSAAIIALVVTAIMTLSAYLDNSLDES